MSTERQPIIEESGEEELEPQPSTESAGGVRPPGRIGSGLFDDEGANGPPPIDPLEVPPGGLRGLPIEDLNLSMRGYNCLRRSGVITVGAILNSSEEDLLSTRNFGRKCYDELREKLNELGIVPIEVGWDEARLK